MKTCAAYVAAVQPCTSANICRGWDGQALTSYINYSVTEFGAYRCGNATTTPIFSALKLPRCTADEIELMEWAMRSEIYARGPISCCMASTDAFHHLRQHGVYVEASDRNYCDHMVSVSGWGEMDGIRYWIVRNSYGSSWGDQGWFRIKRGSNNAGIEQYCAWAVPRDDWTGSTARARSLSQFGAHVLYG